MIRLDLTNESVTVESDGNVESLITVRTLQTTGTASIVARRSPEPPLSSELEETIRTRQGEGASAVVLREYDIREPGEYQLTSGRRRLSENRTFFIRVEFVDNATMRVSVLSGSAGSSWIVNDDVLDSPDPVVTPDGPASFFFEVLLNNAGVVVDDGVITRIGTCKAGVVYHRQTAWERLLNEDPPDPV